MKMKKYIIILLLLFPSFFYSCEDFLDEINRSAQGYEFIRTEEGIQKLLLGSYSYLRTFYGRETFFQITEFGSDLWSANDGDGSKPFLSFDSNLSSSNSSIEGFWNSSYQSINNANAVIDYTPEVSSPNFVVEGVKEKIIAEAKFLRALNYFNLVRSFGKVPLVMETSEGFQTEIARSDEDMVFEAIIEDLHYAIKWLPYQSEIPASEWGRASKGAAQLLLSKVFLTRASEFYIDKGHEEYDLDSAIYYATRLIPGESEEAALNGYQLLPDFGDLYGQNQLWEFDGSPSYPRPYNQGNEEIIFAVQFGPVNTPGNPPSGVTGSGGNNLSVVLAAFQEKQNRIIQNVVVRPSILPLDYESFRFYDEDGKLQVGSFPDARKYTPRSLEQGNSYVRCFPNPYTWEVFDADLNEGVDYKADSRFYKTNRMIYKAEYDHSSIPEWQNNLPADAPDYASPGEKRFGVGDTAIMVILENMPADYAEKVDRTPYFLYYKEHYGSRIFPSNVKHFDEYREDAGSRYGTREVVVLRLAEAYMVAAEAYGRQGNYGEAVRFFNEIRRRAAYKEGEEKPKQVYLHHGGQPGDESSTEAEMEISVNAINSTEKLIEFVLNEKAREFIGEGKRWFDLQRTMRLVERVKKYNLDENAFMNVQDFHLLKPIPQSHIERLEGDINITEEQNEGYY